jgi:proteic killer suppression protein
MSTRIQITRQAVKGLEKAPQAIRSKFNSWANAVQLKGLVAVQQVSGYHDEPLQGQRKGQRSVRLNKQWRAIYTVTEQDQILVTVLEVNAHDYRTK